MTKKRAMILGAIVAIPVLALAWWLGSPLFLDTEVNEEFPVPAAAETPDETTTEAIGTVTTAETPSTEATGEEMQADPEAVSIATGDFQGFDDFHQGSGTATVYELEDGSLVLRLEDFEVTNGPDLHVYLVPDADPATTGNVDGYLDLGSLKGNLGDQNYDIPSEVDPSTFGSVVIYCQPFAVIFSTASLA